MTIKSVFATFSGFLAHHAVDLNATATALEALLSALPVNAQTREQIDAVIGRVKDSAVNIENSLVAIAAAAGGATAGGETVQISQADIDAAVARTLPEAVAAYLTAHPPVAAPDVDPEVPATFPAATGSVVTGA
jgi:hypothetical protein